MARGNPAAFSPASWQTFKDQLQKKALYQLVGELYHMCGGEKLLSRRYTAEWIV